MLAAALAAVGGVQVAYFPIWFDARGLDGREIAAVLAAAPAARIVSNLLGTHLADRRGDYGRLILVLQTFVTLIFAGMDVAQGFIAIFITDTLLCFVQGPIGPIFDGLTLDEAQRRRKAGRPGLDALPQQHALTSMKVLRGPVAAIMLTNGNVPPVKGLLEDYLPRANCGPYWTAIA